MKYHCNCLNWGHFAFFFFPTMRKFSWTTDKHRPRWKRRWLLRTWRRPSWGPPTGSERRTDLHLRWISQCLVVQLMTTFICIITEKRRPESRFRKLTLRLFYLFVHLFTNYSTEASKYLLKHQGAIFAEETFYSRFKISAKQLTILWFFFFLLKLLNIQT